VDGADDVVEVGIDEPVPNARNAMQDSSGDRLG
jgi:hypothetical protein